jgi:RNA-directed DNA polymerase
VLKERLANELLLSPGFIELISNTASYRYKRYEIPKARGGKRTIYHPAKELKALQRCLLGAVICRLPVQPAAAAYLKGRNIADHAMRHRRCRFLLRVDLRDFFESITSSDIERHLRHFSEFLPSDWEEADFDFLTTLVCRRSRLTVGSVTSPAISNTVCWHLDHELTALAERRALRYSRYADDLYFSAAEPNVLASTVTDVKLVLADLPYPRLSVNDAKTRHMSHKGRMSVTGIVLPSDASTTVSVGRARKRAIRSLIYKWDALAPMERLRVQGMLANARSVEPDLINRLILKYGTTLLTKIHERQ